MIRRIDARSIEQITSGQVITSPVSVVKELLENALDAGASSVEIRVVNHGKDGISVQDNGGGIAEADFALVAARHATSKLAAFAELAAVRTLGFRGEAVASLCAVADVVFTTKTKAGGGWRVQLDHGGRVVASDPVQTVNGTLVDVQNLFAGLPVRRKTFERHSAREFARITALVQEYALLSPARISLVHSLRNRGSALRSQGRDMLQRVASIYGAKRTKTLTVVDMLLEGEEGDGKGVRLRGVLSKAAFGMGDPAPVCQLIAVNGRPSQQPRLVRAVVDAYKVLNVAETPFFVLDLALAPEQYDVNVSPDKRALLLHDEDAVVTGVRAAVAALVGDGGEVPRGGVQQAPKVPEARQSLLAFALAERSERSEQSELSELSERREVQTGQSAEQIRDNTSYNASDSQGDQADSEAEELAFKRELEQLIQQGKPMGEQGEHEEEEEEEEEEHECCSHSGADGDETAGAATPEPAAPAQSEAAPAQAQAQAWRQNLLNTHVHLPTTLSAVAAAAPPPPEKLHRVVAWAPDEAAAEQRLQLRLAKSDFAAMDVVGQFNLGFILVVSRQAQHADLFVVDQHASDEIYNFERLQQRTVLSRQPLVTPFALELSAAEELVLQAHLPVFERNGFSIAVDAAAPPGRQCALVAVPYSKTTLFDERDVLELLSRVKAAPEARDVRCAKLRSMLAMRACRSSIMIGTALDHATMESVVRHMGELERPWNCPHGRPTLRHITTLR